MVKIKYNSYKKSAKTTGKMNEEELYKRLFTTISAILLTLILLFVVFRFFGPKLGSLFGLISVHRNDPAERDKITPVPPIFSLIPKATNKKKLTLNGISEPGSSVFLFMNGSKKSSIITSNDGLFTFTDLELTEGKNTIFARATDKNDNESDDSEKAIVVLDTKKPEIKIDSPVNGETVRNLNKRIDVKGKLNEKANVMINGRVAIVQSDLTFGILLGVEEGNISIKVVATDEAGNSKDETVFAVYQKAQ